MAYEFPVDPQELFGERQPQILSTGLPAEDVKSVRSAITDMWQNQPGGWNYEWSSLARRYVDEGQTKWAMLAFGWAKFPTLANQANRDALAKQLDQYLKLVPDFPVPFERKVLDLAHKGGRTAVPVHIFGAPGLAQDAPVLLATGGVDAWKMDLHDIFVGLAKLAKFRVMVFDIPGTGDSQIPMTADGGAEVVSGLIAEARATGARKIGYLGISMGGNYSARSGLSGEVDAAISLGGPVDAAFDDGHRLRFGMQDIIGNAMGYDHRPDPHELQQARKPFSLRYLLDQDINVPMLVMNGADDVHVPRHDTLVFEGRRDTEVHLFPDAGHCAPNKFDEITPIMVGWLSKVLA